ncbi:MAG: 2TM domain-containing protein [Gaiellaceae bacterium]
MLKSIRRCFMAVSAPPKREQPPEVGTSAAGVDEAREYAIATLKRKRKFAQDSVAYVAVNVLLWLIWLFTGHSTNGSIPWPAWVSLVWGFFLALDGWRAYGRWPASRNTPITETEIDRELERTQSR